MDMYIKQLFYFFVLILIVCNSVSSEIEKPSAPFGSPQRSFERMDLDKDGLISYEEYLSAYERRIKRRFNMLDSNSDGTLSMDEFENQRSLQRRFQNREGSEKPLAPPNN